MAREKFDDAQIFDKTFWAKYCGLVFIFSQTALACKSSAVKVFSRMLFSQVIVKFAAFLCTDLVASAPESYQNLAK